MKRILRILSALMCMTLLMTAMSVFAPSAAAESNETKVYNFLRNTMGLNNAVATGIVANIAAESNFNPKAQVTESDGYISYGICQWHKGRYDSLKTFCTNNKYDYTTIDAQLKYLKYELENGEKESFNRMKNHPNSSDGAFAAAYGWATYFERCAAQYRLGRAERAVSTYWPKYTNGVKTTYTYPEEGTYVLRHIESGKCLAAESTTDSSTTEVVLQLYSEKNTQQFILKKSYYGYIIQPVSSNKSYVVNPYASTVTTGKNITLYSASGDPSQNWYFVKADGGYRIVNGQNPTVALDYAERTPEGNTSVKVKTVSTEKRQVFELLTLDEAKYGKTKPAKTTVSVDKTQYKNGETVNVSWSAASGAASYEVVFKCNGTVISTKSVTDTKTSFTLSKDGAYTVTVNSVNPVGNTPSDDVSFTAGYYTVTYSAVGSDKSNFSQSKYYGESPEITSVEPFIKGKSFLGWSKTDNAESPQYIAGDKITENASFTLYAVWQDLPPVYEKGDANGDGEILMNDVLVVRRYIAGIINETELIYDAADCNGDGDITNVDLLKVRRMVAGIE